MTVAIIPARNGSRRIPGKNVRPFFGKPIIWYSLDAAVHSGLFDQIVVTTDGGEVWDVVEQYGVELVPRERGLELDEVGTQEVVRATLKQLDISEGGVCCIYPCAPLLTARDLLTGERVLAASTGASYVFVRGVYYWGAAQLFLENVPLIRSLELTSEHIDINTPEDWALAEEMYLKLHPEVA